jgi:hypothetical protein
MHVRAQALRRRSHVLLQARRGRVRQRLRRQPHRVDRRARAGRESRRLAARRAGARARGRAAARAVPAPGRHPGAGAGRGGPMAHRARGALRLLHPVAAAFRRPHPAAGRQGRRPAARGLRRRGGRRPRALRLRRGERAALLRALLPAAPGLPVHPQRPHRHLPVDVPAARGALEQHLHARRARLRGGAVEPHGGLLHAGARRDGHRQGRGGGVHRALGLHSLRPRAPALRGQLHRDLHRHQPLAVSRDDHRVGALRPPQGRLHGRDRAPRRHLRALQRARGALPRRDRRSLHPGADQAAAGAAGAHLHRGRRARQAALRRARDRRDQPAARRAAP